MSGDGERGCIDVDQAMSYLGASAPHSDVTYVENHLSECAPCRRFILELARDPEFARTIPPSSQPELPATHAETPKTLGRYQVEGEIGRGAMGVVLLASDPELARTVAIKCVHNLKSLGESTQEEVRARMVREAQAMAQLEHKNVVRVYDTGETPEGVYIAMQYVEGDTLDSWMQKATHPWRLVLKHFLAAAAGLSAAHRVGIVHRDFKPSNVLMDSDSNVFVADFGLSGALRSEELVSASLPDFLHLELTRTKGLLGTPAYMAPEQIDGQAADAKSDQYAFFVSLYEAVTGTPPFGRTTLRAQREAQRRAIPKNMRLPRRLSRLIDQGLAEDPANRFASMDEVEQELGRLLRGRRARHVAIPTLLGGAAVAGAIAFGLSRSAPASPMKDARKALGAVWPAGHRAQLLKRGNADLASAIDAYAERWVEARLSTWAESEALAPHLSRTRSHCLDHVLAELSRKLDAEAADLDAETLSVPEVCAEISDARLGLTMHQRSDERGVALVHLAQSFRKHGDYQSAASLVEELVGQGPGPVLSTQLQIELAELALVHAKRSLAVTHLSQAEAIAREHENKALLIEVLARKHRAADNNEASEKWLQEAQELAKNTTEDQPSARVARWQLAKTQAERAWDRDDTKEALVKGMAASDLADRLFGEESLEHIEGSIFLGSVHRWAGDHEQAQEYLNEAMALADRRLPKGHPTRADALLSMAKLYMLLANRSEALAHFQRARTILSSAFGANHLRVLPALEGEAALLCIQGKTLDEGIALLFESLAIKDEALGPTHPDLQTTLDRLLTVLVTAGHWSKVQAIERRVLELLERYPNKALHARTLTSLGLAAIGQENLERAKQLLEESHNINVELHGAESMHLVTNSVLIAEVALLSGEYRAAEKAFETVANRMEANVGPNYGLLGIPLLGLGSAKLALGEAEAAHAIFERAARIAIKTDLADPVSKARLNLAYAKAMWELKRHRPVALELAKKAQETLLEHQHVALVSYAIRDANQWLSQRQ